MKDVMNLPNKLTILRVILVPLYIVSVFLISKYVAMGVFILASVTDFADGKIARSRGLVTNFGKFLDPLADKLLVTAALVCFVQLGQLPAWVAIVVIGRDLAVDGLRMIAATRNKVMAAGWSGKIKTATTMFCIPIMLIEPLAKLGWGVFTVNNLCVLIILALNIYSMCDYFIHNGKVIFEQ